MSEIFQKLSNNPKALELCIKLCKDGVPDKKIQEELLHHYNYKWNLETIRRHRRKLGINKKTEPAIQVKENAPTSSVPPPGLNNTEQAKWFKKQFIESHLYIILKSQFTTEEIDVYLEEYGSLCTQFSDIVTSEFFQIDEFLKHRILINRQLILMKSFQEEITELTGWVAKNPIKDDEDKDVKQMRIQQYRLLDQKRSDFAKVSERYDKLVTGRDKIYSNLAATRKDRIDELRGGRESFFNLVAMLQSSEAERDKQGKYAALTRIASQDIKEHWREPQELPDGTVEPLILDSETFTEEEDS
jgi:hypothetical protein